MSHPVYILLVEDNRGDVDLVRLALRHSGLAHTLEVATNADRALELLERPVGPDIVVLDLNLPGLDGGCLLDLMGADPRFAKIPVVILSSSQAPRDQARAAELRHGIYIPKPSDLDAFLAIGPAIANFWRRTFH